MILDAILLGITTLIVRTDNLMLKNNKEVLNDYFNLKAIKERIEDYTLLKDRNIEQIKLWDEYLTYAVAFGISSKIVNQMKKMYPEDIVIQDLHNNGFEAIYSISKAYLEVFWEMEFKPDKPETNKNDDWFNIDSF